MDARSILGWNIRRLRVDLGLSQERLAFATSIDRSYIGRVERGSENVTIATIEALANTLGVTVRDLFEPPPADAGAPMRLPSGRKPKVR